MRPLNPLQRFALLSSVYIAGLCLVLGLAIALLLEHHMREVEWRRIAEDVRYQADEHQFLPYFTDPQRGRGPAEYREVFGRLLHMPEVVRIKVWDRQATVLWSTDDELIGKRFPENTEVRQAMAGEIAVELKTLHELEKKYGQGPTTTLAEIYVPIHSTTSSEVVGVIEVYAQPARLFASIQRMRFIVWAIVLSGGLLLFFGLLPIVRRSHRKQLELFAAEAAIAIENARLHASIVKQSGELQALLRATRTIMAGLDLRETLERIINEAAQISGIRHVKVVLADKVAGVVRVAAAVGRPAAMLEGFASPLGTGTSGLVAATGQPLYIADCQNDPRNHLYADQDRMLGIQTYLGLPIKVRDEVLGVLTFNTAEPRQYSADELRYLASFADQGAVAIENARLYQEVQRHANELEARVVERTQELEVANQQLQAASQAKSEFLANMSHELRTPLNSILGFGQLLMEQTGTTLSPKQTRYLTHMYNGGQHLLQLISDILDLSKVEAGKFVLQPERLPVAETLEDILVIARGLANTKDQTIRQEIVRGLPWLHADPVRFKQILFNLLSNAVKFTPNNGTITVRARRVPAIADFKLQIADLPTPGPSGQSAISNLQSEMLEIAVTDTGIGIRAEDLPRLFQEFVQLENAKSQEGTGLGLALTKRLVELHGGRIWVTSPGEGKGSTVTVVLPWTMNGS